MTKQTFKAFQASHPETAQLRPQQLEILKKIQEASWTRKGDCNAAAEYAVEAMADGRPVFVLYEKAYYTDGLGAAVACSEDPAKLDAWVKQYRPTHKRDRSKECWERLRWFECDEARTLLLVDSCNNIPNPIV